MSKYCKTHVVERTEEELNNRLRELAAKGKLGPGLVQERENIKNELSKRRTAARK